MLEHWRQDIHKCSNIGPKGCKLASEFDGSIFSALDQYKAVKTNGDFPWWLSGSCWLYLLTFPADFQDPPWPECFSNWKLCRPKCGWGLPHFGRYSFKTQQSIFCMFASFSTFFRFWSLSIQGIGKKKHRWSLHRGSFFFSDRSPVHKVEPLLVLEAR
jgi:hypothetical protein